MRKWSILVLFIGVISSPMRAQMPSGEELLKKVDANQHIDKAVSVTSMIIHSRSGTRTIRSKAWIEGNEKALVEYLAPPREQGKKMLKLGKQLWIYTPEPNDRIITISGHLLRQSVMGSDLSYEDMMESDLLAEDYRAVVKGQERFQGRDCWVLELTAKREDIAYHSRKIWIDTERYIPLKEERYARSGKLLKTTVVHDVLSVAGRWYPRHLTFKDMLMRSAGTEFIVESIDFDVDIPTYYFTKAALKR